MLSWFISNSIFMFCTLCLHIAATSCIHPIIYIHVTMYGKVASSLHATIVYPVCVCVCENSIQFMCMLVHVHVCGVVFPPFFLLFSPPRQVSQAFVNTIELPLFHPPWHSVQSTEYCSSDYFISEMARMTAIHSFLSCSFHMKIYIRHNEERLMT